MCAYDPPVADEKRRLENEISNLKGELQRIKTEYREKLQEVKRESTNATLRLEKTIKDQHQMELNCITSEYNRLQRETNKLLEEKSRELQKKIEDDNKTIYEKIATVENQILSKLEKEKNTADIYIERMHQEWKALCGRTELLQYVIPNQISVDYADTQATNAYNSQMYQATTAIMVNTSLLIGCWEKRAEALYEEWKELYELCEEIENYLEEILKISKSQKVNCDDVVGEVNLHEYLPNDYSRLEEKCSTNRAKLDNCSSLTNEEMRFFLHDLQQDQILADDLIKNSMILHCAFVRRLRCANRITKGLGKNDVKRVFINYKDDNKLEGIRIIFKERYLHDVYVVLITSPNPEFGRTEINVDYHPANVMDEKLRYRCCNSITKIIASLADDGFATRLHDAYIETDGVYRADIEIQHAY